MTRLTFENFILYITSIFCTHCLRFPHTFPTISVHTSFISYANFLVFNNTHSDNTPRGCSIRGCWCSIRGCWCSRYKFSKVISIVISYGNVSDTCALILKNLVLHITHEFSYSILHIHFILLLSCMLHIHTCMYISHL
jgi:hypothetical protein